MKKSREERNDEPLALVQLDVDGDEVNSLGEKLPADPPREWTLLEDGSVVRTDTLLR